MARAGLILSFQISQQYLTKIKRLMATIAMIESSLNKSLLTCQIPTPHRIVIQNYHFGQKKSGVEAPRRSLENKQFNLALDMAT
jgi:hypothetical protein